MRNGHQYKKSGYENDGGPGPVFFDICATAKRENYFFEANSQPIARRSHLYKETFVKIVFDHVKYKPNDKEQSWLEQYGLIKKKEKKAVVANNIYKERFIDTFFSETELPEDISKARYVLPGNL